MVSPPAAVIAEGAVRLVAPTAHCCIALAAEHRQSKSRTHQLSAQLSDVSNRLTAISASYERATGQWRQTMSSHQHALRNSHRCVKRLRRSLIRRDNAIWNHSWIAATKASDRQRIHRNELARLEKSVEEHAKRAKRAVDRLQIYRERATCGICSELLRNPAVLECGHTVCASCWEQWIRAARNTARTPTCPYCRVRLPRSFAKNLIISDIARECALHDLGSHDRQ